MYDVVVKKFTFAISSLDEFTKKWCNASRDVVVPEVLKREAMKPRKY